MSASEAAPAIRALVVDDDALILGLLGAFLASRGYAVEHCDDGAAALDRVVPGRINLVITDRHMPRMDGLALCRAIRALPSDTYVYCIMLTSSRDESALVAAMEAGVDDFVTKPLRLPELGARLHAAERVLSLEAGLAHRNRQLADAYGQLSRDLELARTLQVGQLPAPRSFGPMRFDWMFEASGFVGGDTLDFFAVDARHLCFSLADVSGHGVAAAMMAFHAQHQLRAASQRMASALSRPAADLAGTAVGVITEYNRRFLEMNEDSLYLTIVFGLVDLQARRAALVHAGHPPALWCAGPGADWRAVGEAGVPIGILEEPGYLATCVDLPPGARLVVYSDGVTECEDAEGASFGEARLRALLRENAGRPLAEAGPQLHGALRAWRGAAFADDVTWLALEAG